MSDPLPSVTLFYGEDDFAISESLSEYKTRLGPSENALINSSEFDARHASSGEVRTILDTMPFLTTQRLVVITNLITRTGGLLDRVVVSDVLEYLPSVPEFTALVLVAPGKLPANSRLIKAVRAVKGAAIKNLALPKGGELVSWIQNRAQTQGGEFSIEGAHALTTAAGEETRLIANEIDKLLAYVEWSRPVHGEDVERLTPAASHANIFKLVDALGQRQGRVAMTELRHLLDQPGQDPFSIFAMIVRQFRLLLLARELQDQGARIPEIASGLGVQPFVAEKIASQARRYRIDQLERIYTRLLELDIAMKSGADQLVTLDTLVAGLTA